MIDWFLKILFLIFAYLLGSIPFGFLFGKMKGVDIRTVGSKNIGATNTGRVLGTKYAIYVYLLDMIKGFIFVFLFRYKILSENWCLLNPMLYGFAAVLGHTFPIYLGFKGGKSVACGSGAVAGYCPILLPIAIIAFIITAYASKYVSLGSLVAAVVMFISTIVTSLIFKQFNFSNASSSFYPYNLWFILFTFLILIVIFIRHSSNIKRLITGEENKVELKK